MKKKIFVVIFAALLMTLTSCSFAGRTKWTFDNHTPYSLSISVDGGLPDEFTLYAYGEQSVYVYGDTIKYRYNYAGLVYVSQSGTTLNFYTY